MKSKVIITKQLGETPLEALERFRAEHSYSKDVPMTYAGRLDPLAEGELIILIGDECKNKEKYLGFDKEYEVEVLFGISTDTHDVLGLAQVAPTQVTHAQVRPVQEYLGKFTQPYPAYSSKTVDGVQLHTLSRRNELPEEMPSKEVEIYEIEILGQEKIAVTDLKERIMHNIALVKGDFRQQEIISRWNEVCASLDSNQSFPVIKIRVKCSSGTYMRSLADRMGKDAGVGGFALGIKRTKIYRK